MKKTKNEFKCVMCTEKVFNSVDKLKQHLESKPHTDVARKIVDQELKARFEKVLEEMLEDKLKHVRDESLRAAVQPNEIAEPAQADAAIELDSGEQDQQAEEPIEREQAVEIEPSVEQEEFRKTYLAELLQAEASVYREQDAETMKLLGQKANKFELDAWRQSEEKKETYVKYMKVLTCLVRAGSVPVTELIYIRPNDLAHQLELKEMFDDLNDHPNFLNSPSEHTEHHFDFLCLSCTAPPEPLPNWKVEIKPTSKRHGKFNTLATQLDFGNQAGISVVSRENFDFDSFVICL